MEISYLLSPLGIGCSVGTSAVAPTHVASLASINVRGASYNKLCYGVVMESVFSLHWDILFVLHQGDQVQGFFGAGCVGNLVSAGLAGS